MKKELNILYVASECFPYAKESGLADVAASLPIALRELGHDIRVVIPKYGSISERRNKIHEINRLKEIEVEMSDGRKELLVAKSSTIQTTKTRVQVYVITNESYFGSRKGLYHNPKDWSEYDDNLERFIFFSKGVLEICQLLGWYPDVIHCNDWQTALIPAYINYNFASVFKKTKTVLTIHNVAAQGECALSNFSKLCLPSEAKESFTHRNKLNILKGGMLYTDQVTTVSPSYLKDFVRDRSLTNGLNGLLKLNENRILGIKNGIDTLQWNPRTDPLIKRKFVNFDYDDESEEMTAQENFQNYKDANKQALCMKCKLTYNADTPLIGMITRIDEQKGIDVLIKAMDALLKLDLQLVILGQGNVDMKSALMEYKKQNGKKLALMFEFNGEIAHLIEAGSDIYMMPSRQEGCGLNFLYSLVYGSVPIVNMVGGIKDNAVPLGKNFKEGMNSIAMSSLTVKDMAKAVKEAIDLYKDKEMWFKLVEAGMSGDYSWRSSASEYSSVYKRIYSEK